MPNTSESEKFVPRFEMAVMEYTMLNKAKQGEVTRDNLQQTFRGNLQMSSEHFDHCLQRLVREGHLREVGGNKYTITDDGREDIQKLQHLALELPNVVGQGGGRQVQGQGATPGQGVGQGGQGQGVRGTQQERPGETRR